MDAGELSALTTIIAGLLTAFGAGNVVPLVGPAVQGILAVVTLGAAIYSFVVHRQNTAAMVAAGIKR